MIYILVSEHMLGRMLIRSDNLMIYSPSGKRFKYRCFVEHELPRERNLN